MPSRSDFVWVIVDATIGSTIGGSPKAGMPYSGSMVERKFTIDGVPKGEGYLLVQAYDVNKDVDVRINGHKLPSWDLPPAAGRWQTWVDRIQSGALQHGENVMTFQVAGADAVAIRGVVVHWREEG